MPYRYSPCIFHILLPATAMVKFHLSLFLLSLLLTLGSFSNVATSTRSNMVEYYEIKRNDFSIKITNWGAAILSVVLPDAKGNLADIALGYDTTHSIGGYVNGTTNFGVVAGRVANRIAGARFVLNGKAYRLYPNDHGNCLHGGHRGYGKVLWSLVEKVDGDYPHVTLYYQSFDGEQGFPGDLDVFVTYKITGDYELKVEMSAKPLTQATPVNLAQHTYWNLAGHNSGTILSNKVQIFASHVTPTDSLLIPTGEIRPVAGTPFDFLEPETVGSRIDAAGGYDINYVLNGPTEAKYGLRKTAVVEDVKSGRTMELFTDQPGVQFYTSNMLKDTVGKGGFVYRRYGGLCLETQGFPNAVNQKNFPSQIVNPGETYKHNMLFKFTFH